MAIEVHRRGDRRVTEPLLGNLGMDAGAQQLSSVRMPQIMEADAG